MHWGNAPPARNAVAGVLYDGFMGTEQTLEKLRQSEQRRTEQRLAAVTEVLTSWEQLQVAEEALNEARTRYAHTHKTATQSHWTPQELKDAGLPAPVVGTQKRRPTTRRNQTPNSSDGHAE